MILIGNGRLITLNEKNPYIESGAVVIDKNKIADFGEFKDLKNIYTDAEFIDAENRIIMPGLINAHEHIYSAFARGSGLPKVPPKGFTDVLEGTWWHLDRNLDLKSTYYSAAASYLESIRNGVTSVIDHHAGYGAVRGSLFEIEKAASKLGVRTCLAYEISDREGRDKMKESVKENMEFIKYADEKNTCMLKGLVGMHASFTLSDETLLYAAEKNISGAGYHIHIAEGLYDEEHSQKNYNMSAVKRLEKFNILGPSSIAGHCIHISDEDMDIIKNTETSVIHNPESNMANAVGAPDIIKMLDKGITAGLGTDGYTHDMFESVKTANILQKHKRGLPDRGFNEAAQLLFKNNSKIASKIFKTETGVIKKGAAADIIISDYRPFTEINSGNIYGHLIFGMSGAMTDTVIINGKTVMKDRIMCCIDEEKILNEAKKAASDLWKRL